MYSLAFAVRSSQGEAISQTQVYSLSSPSQCQAFLPAPGPCCALQCAAFVEPIHMPLTVGKVFNAALLVSPPRLSFSFVSLFFPSLHRAFLFCIHTPSPSYFKFDSFHFLPSPLSYSPFKPDEAFTPQVHTSSPPSFHAILQFHFISFSFTEPFFPVFNTTLNHIMEHSPSQAVRSANVFCVVIYKVNLFRQKQETKQLY